MELLNVLNIPEVPTPVMFMHLDGWIDAGNAGSLAMQTLLDETTNTLIASFEIDELIDYRSRRPVDRLTDGRHDGISWPELTIRATSPFANGESALILSGPEPDFRWHAFSDAVVSAVKHFGVRDVIGLSAFPAPVPHTRAVGVASTTHDTPVGRELATRIGFVPGSAEIPAGMQAVIEQRLGSSNINAIGLWARVPHYVANMTYAPASVAVLEAAAIVSGYDLPFGDLIDEAAKTMGRIDELISGNEEHAEMVRQLEAAFDSGSTGYPRIVDQALPTADELAAELERFLREQQP